MNVKTRFVTALLAMISAANIVSCSSNDPPTDITTVSESDDIESTGSTTDENGFLLDSLPDSLGFGGETVTILGWNHYEDIEFHAEELNGDIVNDAYYNRNLIVEQRLDVKLEFLEADARTDQHLTKIRNSVMSGTGEYDITAAHSHRASAAAAEGLLLNIMNVDHIDLDKPWWSQSLKSEITIGGALYLLSGDISASSTARLQGMFFNNDFINKYSLEDPYDIVIEGQWTVDKMFEMSAGIYMDLNSDGKKTEADQFGFACDVIQFQAPMYSCGIRSVDVTQEGGLTVSPTISSEKAADLLVKLCGFVNNTDDATKIKTVDDDKIFIEGRCLFYAFPLGLISSGDMRDVKFSYGFIPWPKYDAAQKNYIVSSSNAFSMWGIPIDAENPSMSGAVMEAMASGGYRLISPALFETAYKVKYNSMDSERQSEIFDMLKSNVTYDIGKLFMGSISNNIMPKYSELIVNNKTNWISTVDSMKDGMQISLDNLVETFRTNAE